MFEEHKVRKTSGVVVDVEELLLVIDDFFEGEFEGEELLE